MCVMADMQHCNQYGKCIVCYLPLMQSKVAIGKMDCTAVIISMLLWMVGRLPQNPSLFMGFCCAIRFFVCFMEVHFRECIQLLKGGDVVLRSYRPPELHPVDDMNM